jgi:uncharacterized protein YebE (UPF0316 family)
MAIGQIMKNLNNPINYIAYATGFAMGNYVGILIENKLAMGVSMIRVITRKDATALVDYLQKSGYTTTNVDAEGNGGIVKIIFTVIRRKEISNVVEQIKKFNPNAFYTIEEVGYVSRNSPAATRRRHRFMRYHILKRK